MEDINIVRLSPLRPGGGGLKSPSSGKSTPRGSPSFRRLSSGRTPRREGARSGGHIFSYCFRSNRIVLWLLLITLWAYAGFYFQSRWAHGDNKEDLFSGGYGGEINGGKPGSQRNNRRDLIAAGALKSMNGTSNSSLENVEGDLAERGSGNSLHKSKASKKRSKRSGRSSRRRSSSKLKIVPQDVESEVDVPIEEIPKKNTTYGFLVGPFGSVEDSILDWSPEKRSGTCDRKGAFARLVWSRKFVLIFHELTMTGAPLAMMELATEFLSCGATISVIVLNKKGSLMSELHRRKIKVLEDKSDVSFKTAMKANIIIAGSAVCSSWIGENTLMMHFRV